ncbi:unnamed protein product [Bursaphelenchus okinawaensis]|uniref:protein-tyrosine-phosphatase n=1 Tax=Bursaphelenchus okinawaensis TaxID=465554 RepID=A0A811K6R8_9BILA|nr:unnamed protein product [Bursaphelenchus okinawaensis]CAG9092592.1 unnamed protein product [Bursaphelenchus okinawaensis]
MYIFVLLLYSYSVCVRAKSDVPASYIQIDWYNLIPSGAVCRHFQLEYYPPTGSPPSHSLFAPQVLNVTIEDTIPATEYYVNVTALVEPGYKRLLLSNLLISCPPKPILEYLKPDSTGVTFAMLSPIKAGISYYVEYYEAADSDQASYVETSQSALRIKGLSPNTRYELKVVALFRGTPSIQPLTVQFKTKEIPRSNENKHRRPVKPFQYNQNSQGVTSPFTLYQPNQQPQYPQHHSIPAAPSQQYGIPSVQYQVNQPTALNGYQSVNQLSQKIPNLQSNVGYVIPTTTVSSLNEYDRIVQQILGTTPPYVAGTTSSYGTTPSFVVEPNVHSIVDNSYKYSNQSAFYSNPALQNQLYGNPKAVSLQTENTVNNPSVDLNQQQSSYGTVEQSTSYSNNNQHLIPPSKLPDLTVKPQSDVYPVLPNRWPESAPEAVIGRVPDTPSAPLFKVKSFQIVPEAPFVEKTQEVPNVPLYKVEPFDKTPEVPVDIIVRGPAVPIDTMVKVPEVPVDSIANAPAIKTVNQPKSESSGTVKDGYFAVFVTASLGTTTTTVPPLVQNMVTVTNPEVIPKDNFEDKVEVKDKADKNIEPFTMTYTVTQATTTVPLIVFTKTTTVTPVTKEIDGEDTVVGNDFVEYTTPKSTSTTATSAILIVDAPEDLGYVDPKDPKTNKDSKDEVTFVDEDTINDNVKDTTTDKGTVEEKQDTVVKEEEDDKITVTREHQKIRLDWTIPETVFCDNYLINTTVVSLKIPKSFTVVSQNTNSYIKMYNGHLVLVRVSCMLENSVSNTWSAQRYVDFRKPEPVKGLHIREVTTDEFYVASVILEIDEVSDTNNKYDVIVTWGLGKKVISTNQLSFTGQSVFNVSGLEPARLYTFSIRNVSRDTSIESAPIGIRQITAPIITSTLYPGQISSYAINVNYDDSAPEHTFEHYELMFIGNSKNITKKLAKKDPKTFTFNKLIPGKTYTFILYTVYKNVKSRPVTQDITTYPLKARKFNAMVGPGYATLTWEVENVANNDCQFRLEYASTSNSGIQKSQKVKLQDVNMYRFTGLHFDTYYTFTITVLMGKGDAVAESESEMITVGFKSRPTSFPTLKRQGSREMLLTFENDPRLFADTNGVVDNFAVIVTQDPELGGDGYELKSYYDIKDEEVWPAYRTSHSNYNPFKRGSSRVATFVIGEEDCDRRKLNETYCNGVLKSHVDYYAKVRAYMVTNIAMETEWVSVKGVVDDTPHESE